jgi:hypothetical protein
MTAAHTDDPVPLVLTKATPVPGWESPADATIVIRPAAMNPVQRAERQAQEAERLAEVLADTLPEGTLQRLVGFILVRTAGARMGIAALGDARGDRVKLDRLAAELDAARDTLERAWGPGEIAHGHSVRVLAEQVVARVQAAETSERLAGLDVREWFTTLTAALDTDPLQVVAVVEEVAARMRGRLGIATPTTPTTPAEP